MTHRHLMSSALRARSFVAAAGLSAGLMLALAAPAHAATYTWLGSADSDWTNTANWQNGTLPSVYPNDATGDLNGDGNTIVIQNGAFDPTANVPDWLDYAVGGGTPSFVVEAGASLTVNKSDVGPGYDGVYTPSVDPATVVTVGNGGSLTWGNADGSNLIILARSNGVQNYNITGGSFTINSGGRLDFIFSFSSQSLFNLDGGTVSLGNTTSLYGTRNNNDFVTPSLVTLANGSVFDAAGTTFNVMKDIPGDTATLAFDLQDTESSIVGKFGGVFGNLAAVEAAEGLNWTSTTLGNDSLVYTDNLDGTFTVTAVPEPASLMILGLGAALVCRRTRKSRTHG